MTTYSSEKIKLISFFSILLVVFLHAYNLDTVVQESHVYKKGFNWFVQDFISYGITRVAVPIFFIISGYLFFLNVAGKKEEFIIKIKKRFKTLLIPFLFWSLAGIAFYAVLQSIPQLQAFFSKELVRDFSFQKWMMTIFINPIPYQLWFIRDLMVLVLFSPVLFFLLIKLRKVIVVIVLILWLFDIESVKNSIEALLFFLSGSYIALFRPELCEWRMGQKSRFFLFFWIIVVFIKTTIVYNGCSGVLVGLLFKISILFGIVTVWGIYDLFLENRQGIKDKLLQGATFTFFIYVFHEPMLTVFKKVLFLVFGKTDSGLFCVYFAAPLGTLIFCMIIGWFLKKYVPDFYSSITGSR